MSFAVLATLALPALALATLARPALAAAGGSNAAAGESQDIAQLETLAKSAAAQELAPLTDRERFIVGPIQSNLELQRCNSLKPVIGTAHHMKDRVTVELRCAGPTAWHLYVPVRIVGTTPVAVTVHALVTGSVLTAADLKVEQHDISELPQGYFDDPAVAVGLTAARPISGGAIPPINSWWPRGPCNGVRP
jgi:flagella basal body P-ring formation protein FlgA